MKCPTCGHENRPEAQFCKQCGQSLATQAAQTEPAPMTGTVCPACGATAKPQARFCPRCGKQLPAEPPPSPKETQPSMAPVSELYAPSPAPPPSSTAPAPKRRSSGWLTWGAGIAAFICIVAVAVAGIVFIPRLIAPPAEPTATPTPEGAAGQFGALSVFNVKRRLGEIRCPVLAVTGSEDQMMPPENARLLAEGIEGAELYMVEKAGHMFFLEEPGQVNRVLMDFFSK